MPTRFSFLCIFICLGISVAYAQQFTSTSYKVLDPVLNGGGYATSSSYQLWTTVSEVAVGTSSSASYQAGGGFLRFPSVTRPNITATSSGDSYVTLSWSSAIGYLGWTVTSYSVGYATVSGGPYTFTNVGNVLTYQKTGLANGTPYYLVVTANDAFGNVIATSSEVLATPVQPVVTFTISTNSVYMGSLSTGATKYASSTNVLGDTSEVEAHNVKASTNAASGYTVYVRGNTLTASGYPTITITALASNTAPSTGQEQFGMRAVASGGSGSVNSLYGGSGFAFAATSASSSIVASAASGDNATTTYSIRYMANISPLTEAGTYQGALVYTMTANF